MHLLPTKLFFHEIAPIKARTS